MNIALPYFKNLWTHHRNVVPISEPQIKINQYFAVKKEQIFPKKLKIVLYSHDTMGLGHKRRNQLIAQTLEESGISGNILIISGIGEGNQFFSSSAIDYLTLPALYKSSDGEYQARHFDMSLKQIIKMRSQLILTAMKNFQPDVFIVDNVPRGAINELNPILKYLRKKTKTKCILGLRDILDDPDVIKNSWQKNNYEDAIRKYYDQVWIYGDEQIYDSIQEYTFSPDIVSKLHYTGYLDQTARIQWYQKHHHKTDLHFPSNSLALCMVGGGQDGGNLALAFAQSKLPKNTYGIIVTGPMMPPSVRQQIQEYCEMPSQNGAVRSNLQVLEYVNEPTLLLKKADWVVSMGGYNSTCEILSFQKRALIVPRITPRKEQLIRTEILNKLGFVDMLHPQQLSADALSQWFRQEKKHHPQTVNIDLDGLKKIPQLITEIVKKKKNSAKILLKT
ncbi:glycosyltransferase family protein [Cyanobacterium aponinum]|uniref:glycosyltransferase family protein n=1 Tax=Cyanobacterium aponinum TaxID=379064 RepID=UPI000C12D066|nr:glycosyltransferase [Cyanobacterium aponinum]PHV63913.1 glycosyltransferase [Cyanobacterium aponinum IPPAS B-1201]